MSLPVPEIWFLNVTVLYPDGTPFTNGRVNVFDVNSNGDTLLNSNGLGSGTTSLTWNKGAFCFNW